MPTIVIRGITSRGVEILVQICPDGVNEPTADDVDIVVGHQRATCTSFTTEED